MVSDVIARRVLIGLEVLAVVLVGAVLWPFVTVLLVAAALAGALASVERRLTRRLHGRRRLAAALLVVAVLFALVLPLGGLLTFAVREAVQAAQSILATLEGGGPAALVARLPRGMQGWAADVAEWLRRAIASSEGLLGKLGGTGAQAALAVGGAIVATTAAIVKVVLFLIALYFFLVDGPRLVAWIEDVAPLAPGQARALLREFRRTTSAVIRSTVLTGLVQSAVATIGFLVARAPQPVFLALVTFVLSLVPAAGASTVTVTTGVVLLLTGHLFGGIFLCAWGLFAVGLVDNVVKPLFLKGGMEVHGAVVFFALLGGLLAFGPVGLLVGPLAVSFLLAVVRLSRSAPEIVREDELPEPSLPPADEHPLRH